MDTLFFIISILSFVAIFVFVILAIIQFAKKDQEKGKKQIKFVGIAGALMIASFIGFISTTDSDKNSKENNKEKVETVAKPKEETPEEKAAAEQKAKEETEARAKAAEEAKAKAEAERLAKLESLKLSGSGDSVTKKVKLNAGFVIIDATHQGSRNFAVKLLDSNANTLKLVVNEIGNYSGKKIYAIPAGEYLYEVTASGPWTINMSQDIPKDVSPEGKVSGKGDSVVFMNISKGAKKVSFTHDGSSNFSVKANDSALLVNEIGAYSGSKVQKVEDTSIYFFDIIADGNWTMAFE
ncbi:hypothetical protein ACIQYL_10980 [Lysinibacillus xylanilyticus]|uniref:hypothetical protein n=1 Tax=Lysinibacillus xylanilyticus TaxID=582475 RepID=UPI003824F98A